jgi:hypothetical protein
MSDWRVDETPGGLRLSQVIRRALGSEELTWADLLYRKLARVQVYAIYFPSRFDLAADATAKNALESFGRQTAASTSVNFWDPTDPEFSRALTFFDVESPPALVLAKGLLADVKGSAYLDKDSLYTITITDRMVLGDREQLASAINSAHEVLVRGDPKEMAQYVRDRAVTSLLTAITRLAGGLRDEILRCKPKIGLPGGISIQLG